MDSTHCEVHQHANGPGGPEDQAVGKSRGGLNARIHLAVDVPGRLTAPVILTPGGVSDHTAAPDLTADLKDAAVVGDRGYDSKRLRDIPRSGDGEPRSSPPATM